MSESTIDKARQRYVIPEWSSGFFDLDAAGRLGVRRSGGDAKLLPIADVIGQARSAGLRLPILLRFPGILRQRAADLQQAFTDAIGQIDQDSGYTPVYPIKVNQQSTVINTLAQVEGMGLEVGSKPELIAALALSPTGRLLICNGYKDHQYIRLALSGVRLGLQVMLVIEKPSEWPLIVCIAREMRITPIVGVRMRLSSLGKGNWQNTGGERAKFGLTAHQLLDLIEAMRIENCLDWFRLLHFHMGSQISNLRDIQQGVREAGRYYVELVGHGVPLTHLDIGGGLGVDYEGGRSRTYCSMNYSLAQYAQAIVSGLNELCAQHQVPMPHLISESGRALTAHHAVLVTNITATEQCPTDGLSNAAEQGEPVIDHLQALLSDLQAREPEETYLEAEHWLNEGRNLFMYGDLSLTARAQLEPLYYKILSQLKPMLDPAHRRQRELYEQIQSKLSDKYFMNLSIFQSLPDIWAIDQVFPIVPLQRNHEPPDRRVVLEDLTCDSDGRIDRYVEHGMLEPTLALHSIGPEEQYLVGIFMTGAYQETLGDIHNLFGDTDSVDVVISDDGIELQQLRPGDRADQLLQMVGFDASTLLQGALDKLDDTSLNQAQRDELTDLLKQGLSAYTYLDTQT